MLATVLLLSGTWVLLWVEPFLTTWAKAQIGRDGNHSWTGSQRAREVGAGRTAPQGFTRLPQAVPALRRAFASVRPLGPGSAGIAWPISRRAGA